MARRAAAFIKFLNSLARDYGSETEQQHSISPKRKRLNLLYILHDVLHSLKYHSKDAGALALFTGSIETQLVSLVTLAADFDRRSNSKHAKDLDTVLLLWNGYDARTESQTAMFSDSIMSQLLDAAHTIVKLPLKPDVTAEAKHAYIASLNAEEPSRAENKLQEASSIPPKPRSETHGDPAQPWHTLPAGNFLTHFARWKPDRPIKRELISPVSLKPDGADTDDMVHVVDTFLEEVDLLSTPLTELMIKDPAIYASDVGDPVMLSKGTSTPTAKPLRTYYGWSSEFCEKMRTWRRNGPDATPDFVTKWREVSPPRVERPVSPRPYPKSSAVAQRLARHAARAQQDRISQWSGGRGRGFRGGFDRGAPNSRGRGRGDRGDLSSKPVFRITSRRARASYGKTGYRKGKRRPPPLGSLTRRAEKRSYLLNDNGRPGAKVHPLFASERGGHEMSGNSNVDTPMQDVTQ